MCHLMNGHTTLEALCHLIAAILIRYERPWVAHVQLYIELIVKHYGTFSLVYCVYLRDQNFASFIFQSSIRVRKISYYC